MSHDTGNESVLGPHRKEGTYRDHFLDIMHIKVQQIALAGPSAGVSIRFDYSSAKVLKLLIRETEHGNVVFRIFGRHGLEGPVENAAVKFLG